MKALGLIILILWPLIATTQGGTVVRTVSVAKLIDDSIPGQKLQNDLRAEAKKVEALQKRLAAELQSLEKELQQSGSALSVSAR